MLYFHKVYYWESGKKFSTGSSNCLALITSEAITCDKDDHISDNYVRHPASVLASRYIHHGDEVHMIY